MEKFCLEYVMDEPNFCVELSCAFDTSEFHCSSHVVDTENQTIHYIKGLKRFFNLYKKHTDSYENVFVIDNTIESKDQVDPKILEIIPEGVEFIFTRDNKRGKINKGSGKIDSWNFHKSYISKYEYVFSLEPHHFLLNLDFLKKCLLNPSTYFGMDQKSVYVEETEELKPVDNWSHFCTGVFFIETKLLLKYLDFRCPECLMRKSISIERDLCDFFHPEISKEKFDVHIVTDLNVVWYDPLHGYIPLVLCPSKNLLEDEDIKKILISGIKKYKNDRSNWYTNPYLRREAASIEVIDREINKTKEQLEELTHRLEYLNEEMIKAHE